MSGMGATAHRTRLRRCYVVSALTDFPCARERIRSLARGCRCRPAAAEFPFSGLCFDLDHVDLITRSSQRAKKGSVGKP
jgi:hypothetical protein